MIEQQKLLCEACETENNPGDRFCRRCGISISTTDDDTAIGKIFCPRCHNTSDAGMFFCYTCGKYFADIDEVKSGWESDKSDMEASQHQAPKAKVIIPGGTEIILTGIPVFIERSDFDSTLPHDILMSISRQHVLITYNKGKYFVRDYGCDGKGSTNHTKLNGTDIYNQGQKALKDGDIIELACQPELTMTFRSMAEEK